MGNSPSATASPPMTVLEAADTRGWAPTVDYGAVLDSAGVYDDKIVKELLTKLNLLSQVEQLSTLHLPSGAPTKQQAAEYRDTARDFWTVTSAGVLEDGNTSTLGAVKPQSIARLVESLQSFVVASEGQKIMSKKIAGRMIVTHKLNDAIRAEREMVQQASTTDLEGSKIKLAKGKEVEYQASLELGMFFLSSLLSCTKNGNNILAEELEDLLLSLNELFDPSDPTFFSEWSPSPALPPTLPVHLIALSARSNTGTARGTERGSPAFLDSGTAWVSLVSDRPSASVPTWEVCFDVHAPVNVSRVVVHCLDQYHPTLNKYEDVKANNVKVREFFSRLFPILFIPF